VTITRDPRLVSVVTAAAVLSCEFSRYLARD